MIQIKVQGLLNLDVCRSRTNRGDWKMARNITNPKLHGHYAPLNPLNQDEQVRLCWHSCSKGWNILVHICATDLQSGIYANGLETSHNDI
jgi:hypothetical protein